MPKYISNESSHFFLRLDKLAYYLLQTNNSVQWNCLLKRKRGDRQLSTHSLNCSNIRNAKLYSITQKIRHYTGFFLILTTHNNHLTVNTLPISGCYQSVKDKNFESNSQPQFISNSRVLCCYQSVKDKNFESNSQQKMLEPTRASRCYQSVKDKNFESNSQPWMNLYATCLGCYQSVKDKNFESNSQLDSPVPVRNSRCYQSVKDKNFESNSQPGMAAPVPRLVVISLSKIKISKAIHNIG